MLVIQAVRNYIFFLSQEHTFFWENDFLVHAEAVPYASGVVLPDSKEAGSPWFERILLADAKVWLRGHV